MAPRTQSDGGITWHMTASPDGDLTDASERNYPSLFWEGEEPTTFAQDKGFVVEAEAAASFLEDKLAVLGLSEREATESSPSGDRGSLSGAGHWSPSPPMSTLARPSTASQPLPPAQRSSRRHSSGSTYRRRGCTASIGS